MGCLHTLLILGLVTVAAAEWEQVGYCKTEKEKGCSRCTGALQPDKGKQEPYGCRLIGGANVTDLESCQMIADKTKKPPNCDSLKLDQDKKDCHDLANWCRGNDAKRPESKECNWIDVNVDKCERQGPYCRAYYCDSSPGPNQLDATQAFTAYALTDTPPGISPPPQAYKHWTYPPSPNTCLKNDTTTYIQNIVKTVEDAKEWCRTHTHCAGFYYDHKPVPDNLVAAAAADDWEQVGQCTTEPKMGCKRCTGALQPDMGKQKPYNCKLIGGANVTDLESCKTVADKRQEAPASICDSLEIDQDKKDCHDLINWCRGNDAKRPESKECNWIDFNADPCEKHGPYCRAYYCESAPTEEQLDHSQAFTAYALNEKHIGEWLLDGVGCCWNPGESHAPKVLFEEKVQDELECKQKCEKTSSKCEMVYYSVKNGELWCQGLEHSGKCPNTLHSKPDDCGGFRGYTWHMGHDPKYLMMFKSKFEKTPCPPKTLRASQFDSADDFTAVQMAYERSEGYALLAADMSVGPEDWKAAFDACTQQGPQCAGVYFNTPEGQDPEYPSVMPLSLVFSMAMPNMKYATNDLLKDHFWEKQGQFGSTVGDTTIVV